VARLDGGGGELFSFFPPMLERASGAERRWAGSLAPAMNTASRRKKIRRFRERSRPQRRSSWDGLPRRTVGGLLWSLAPCERRRPVRAGKRALSRSFRPFMGFLLRGARSEFAAV